MQPVKYLFRPKPKLLTLLCGIIITGHAYAAGSANMPNLPIANGPLPSIKTNTTPSGNIPPACPSVITCPTNGKSAPPGGVDTTGPTQATCPDTCSVQMSLADQGSFSPTPGPYEYYYKEITYPNCPDGYVSIFVANMGLEYTKGASTVRNIPTIQEMQVYQATGYTCTYDTSTSTNSNWCGDSGGSLKYGNNYVDKTNYNDAFNYDTYNPPYVVWATFYSSECYYGGGCGGGGGPCSSSATNRLYYYHTYPVYCTLNQGATSAYYPTGNYVPYTTVCARELTSY